MCISSRQTLQSTMTEMSDARTRSNQHATCSVNPTLITQGNHFVSGEHFTISQLHKKRTVLSIKIDHNKATGCFTLLEKNRLQGSKAEFRKMKGKKTTINIHLKIVLYKIYQCFLHRTKYSHFHFTGPLGTD